MNKDTKEDKKTFLECMFNNLDDIEEGSDEEVKKELMAMGIDIKKAEESFRKTLLACKNIQKRRQLDDAKNSRLASIDSTNGILEQIRKQALSVKELISRISELQPAVAHREFENWSQEDLESQLADLLSAQQRQSNGGE